MFVPGEQLMRKTKIQTTKQKKNTHAPNEFEVLTEIAKQKNNNTAKKDQTKYRSREYEKKVKTHLFIRTLYSVRRSVPMEFRLV